MPIRDIFHRFAKQAAALVGSPWTFALAVAVIVAWTATGPVFEYSDTWQLVINTGTSVTTFLIVFLIQNTQNRDSKALHLKLDELLRAMKEARTTLVNLEDMPDEAVEKLQHEFVQLAEREAPADANQQAR